MTRFLYGFTGAILAVAFLGSSIVTPSPIVSNPTVINYDPFCTTELCNEVGGALYANVNETIDPCIDFYAHACARLIDDDSKKHMYRREQLESNIQRQLKDLLEEPHTLDVGAVKKAKVFYESCMNDAAITQRGIAPVISMISANGGWPLTQSSDQFDAVEKFTLENIYQNYVKKGSFWPLVRIGPTRGTSQQNKTLKTQWQMTPLKDWELLRLRAKNESILSYESYTKSVIREFIEVGGFNVMPASVDIDVQNMITFERKLWDVVKSTRRSYRPPCESCLITIDQFQARWNFFMADRPDLQFDWLELIRISFDKAEINVDGTEKIFLHPVENLAGITDVLKQTPLRTIVNYVHWHVIYNMLPYTNVLTRTFGDNDVNGRPDWCIEQEELVDVYSFMYIQRHFDKKSRTIVQDMATAIQKEIMGEFDRSEFLTNGEKYEGKQNIARIQKFIGYPDMYNEQGAIDEYYKELNMGSDFFENVLELRLLHDINERKSFRKSENTQRWASLAVKSHFDMENEALVYPAGMLQMPLFHPELPTSVNWGRIGLSMGLDITLLILDAIHNEENPWLGQSSTNSYDKQANCFVHHHSEKLHTKNSGEAFYIPDPRRYFVNDNVGMKIALNAYLSNQNKNNAKGIQFESWKVTPKQLFFYSAANLYCAPYAPKCIANKFMVSSRDRLNTAFTNLKEFADAFKCPVGSPMNPRLKCSIFD